jgi:hypothetical protein
MSNEKARFLFNIYFHFKNKKKHVGDEKFCKNDLFSAPPRALREDIYIKKF